GMAGFAAGPACARGLQPNRSARMSRRRCSVSLPATFCILAAVATCSIACSTDEVSLGSDLPAPGSCAGLCNAKAAPGRCRCDSWCLAYGDCCSDWRQMCGGTLVRCPDVHGECLSSPTDLTHAADCEREYGRVTVDAACAAVNQSCCVDRPV